MILGQFDEKCKVGFEGKDKIKFGILGGAIIIGLILSGVLAYFNIDFMEILKIFSENIANSDILDQVAPVMMKWYIISGICFVACMVLLALYFFSGKKRNVVDVITWNQTIFLAIEIVLLSQIILPIFTMVLAIAIALLYLVFFSSMLLKEVIGYSAYLFALIVNKLCNSSGITLTYGEFIGQERYSKFLLLITFFILIPYLLALMLRMIRKFIQSVTGFKPVELVFKPVEAIFSVNILRYSIYFLLFFISVFTYSQYVSPDDYAVSLVKEALLEFVLLDTVVYSIVSNVQARWNKRERKKIVRYYLPYKADLEFILSAIAIYNMRNKEIYARILFSLDINRLVKEKKTKELNEIDMMLIDLSEKHYKIDILEQRMKVAVRRLTDLLE